MVRVTSEICVTYKQFNLMKTVFFFGFIFQGDQRSPGIIPLAVKDAFDIIQEVLRVMLICLIPLLKF